MRCLVDTPYLAEGACTRPFCLIIWTMMRDPSLVSLSIPVRLERAFLKAEPDIMREFYEMAVLLVHIGVLNKILLSTVASR